MAHSDPLPAPLGYLGSNAPFVRNAQRLQQDMWLAEIQRGKTGKGKVWHHGILVPSTHPEAGQPLKYHPKHSLPRYYLVARTRTLPVHSSTRGMIGVELSRENDAVYGDLRFMTVEQAVKFMIAAVPAFIA
jgi:hypothetical protein